MLLVKSRFMRLFNHAPSGRTDLHSRPLDIQGITGAIAYLGLYIVLDWFSYVQPVLKLGITPWNPQAGLTLAFLVMYGPRWIPVAVLAALCSELLVRHSSVASLLVLGVALWIGLGYGILSVFLRRWHLSFPIRTLGAAGRFAGAALGVTLLVAGGYVVLFMVAGELPPEHAVESLPRLWIGDLTGILTLTPLLISAHEWRVGLQIVKRHRAEVLAQIAALSATLWILYGALDDQLRFFYPLFVPVIWIALRWGASGAMIAALGIQIGLIIAAQYESGGAPLIDLQFLMLTLSLTALLLGAVVTERADALRTAAVREAEQRVLLAMAPDGVLAVDSSGHVRMANSAALRLFGDAGDSWQGAPIADWLPGLILARPEGRATLEGRRKAGGAFPADIAWSWLDTAPSGGFLVTVRDATDRRRAEAKLRDRDRALSRAMRFAVAGELASALTHELNQPITALVSYVRAAQILAEPFSVEEERLSATLGKAAQEAIRASQVLRRLRDFYRGGTVKREDVHISALCQAMAHSFQDRLRRAGATLAIHIDSSVPSLTADATQLEIVLHNLVSNAIDALAIGEPSNRRIELHARAEQNLLEFRIDDSGPGIAPDVAQKLFEPFVTSKADGMGLGLAISRSLVRARGGELFFQPSEHLHGACFVIRLPIDYAMDEIT